MAARGDWRARVCALSALGCIARNEPALVSLAATAARKIPALRKAIVVAGYRGRYIRESIANALVDRAWPVRVAAALALAECRAGASRDALRPLLSAPLRPERIAAAAALRCCGDSEPRDLDQLIANAESVAPRIDATTSATDVLAVMWQVHGPVLFAVLEGRDLSGMHGAAGFLAGPPAADRSGGLMAEVDRYDAEGETDYLLTKPFSRINQAQNVRLLHSFLAASEHLRVPAGADVLDLGGGSGWVSELLETFGFRAYTLDLSTDLLRIGRRRFARENLTPRFAAADMMQLPLASACVDAAIVMDALHHVPDPAAVFREVARVLRPGGVFVVAEPGEGHSETERSRAEMAEFGVQEREIHVFETLQQARTAGFDDVRVVLHAVPKLSMTQEQVNAAIREPMDAWTALDDNVPRHVSVFVTQAMFDRPILVLRKGARIADSRQPAGLRARIESSLVRDGARVTGTAAVANEGQAIWRAGGNAIGDVQLGIHLLDADRRLLQSDLARVALPAPLEPGATLQVHVDLQLPAAADPYVLKLDMVAEHVSWFEDAGSRPLYLPI